MKMQRFCGNEPDVFSLLMHRKNGGIGCINRINASKTRPLLGYYTLFWHYNVTNAVFYSMGKLLNGSTPHTTKLYTGPPTCFESSLVRAALERALTCGVEA